MARVDGCVATWTDSVPHLKALCSNCKLAGLCASEPAGGKTRSTERPISGVLWNAGPVTIGRSVEGSLILPSSTPFSEVVMVYRAFCGTEGPDYRAFCGNSGANPRAFCGTFPLRSGVLWNRGGNLSGVLWNGRWILSGVLWNTWPGGPESRCITATLMLIIILFKSLNIYNHQSWRSGRKHSSRISGLTSCS